MAGHFPELAWVWMEVRLAAMAQQSLKSESAAEGCQDTEILSHTFLVCSPFHGMQPMLSPTSSLNTKTC